MNAYTIGGSVNGLSGGTLVLQNNGGDNVSVSANAGFAFGTALTNGSNYSVTVLAQPAGTTCSVNNGSGVVAGADVSSVSVICVAGSRASITKELSGKFVFDAAGNGIGVWTDTTLSSFFSRYTQATNSWSAPAPVPLITVPTGSTASIIELGMSGDRVIAIWVVGRRIPNSFDVASNIWASTFDAITGQWLSPVPLDIEGIGAGISSVQLVTFANGGVTVTWTGPNLDVKVSSLSNLGWSAPERLNPLPGVGSRIAISDFGDAVAVWSSKDGQGRFHVWARRFFPKLLAWGVAVQIDSFNVPNAFGAVALDVIINPHGSATIVWQELNDQIGTSSTLVSGSDTIGAVPTPIGPVNSGLITNVRLASDANSNALLVWEQSNAAVTRVFASRFTDASSQWSSPVLIGGPGGFAPHIAMSPNGDAVAAWSQDLDAIPGNGGEQGMVSRYSAATNSWTSASPLFASIAVTQVFDPHVLVDANGHGFVTWVGYDGVLGDATWAWRF